jgi:hypothetical protein
MSSLPAVLSKTTKFARQGDSKMDWLEEAEKMMLSIQRGNLSERKGIDKELQTMILVSIAQSLKEIAAQHNSKEQ